MPIFFFSNAKEPLSSLSNLCEVKEGITIDQRTYPSVEHAYQAHKYILKDRHRFTINGDLGTWKGYALVSDKSSLFWEKKHNIGIIAKMATNKKRGIQLGLSRSEVFDSSDELWLDLLKQKYTLAFYKQILLDTGSETLIEFDRYASSRGSKWGGIMKGNVIRGENRMGKLLMRVRELIRQESFQD